MADLTVAEVLERAADLIEPKGRWTQFRTDNPNGSARDADGQAIWSPSSEAICWCLYGAISQICDGHFGLSFKSCRALENFAPEADGASLTHWNDAPERTQAEVVAKLREAATKAREQSA